MFEDLLRAWDGEEVAVRYDPAADAWMFVCVHSTVLGPAAGGTRLKTYAAPDDGLCDGLRLAGAMTSKNAVAGLPLGGGKGVLAVPEIPRGDDRRALLLRYGELVESLHGTYWTACDMNTAPADMDVIAERCRSVFARTTEHGGSGTSAPATAHGVFVGIRASVAHAFGSDDLTGRTVLVQGTGAVGGPLARRLGEAGARTILTDVDEVRAKELAGELGSELVAPDDAIDTECDVFSPCATGGILSAESIPRLRCRVVAGAANNQLAEPAHAELLAQRGILYAPDYVISAGGIIHLAALEMLGEDEARRDERVRAIGDTLTDLFRLADAEDISTEAAAGRMVRTRLEGGPQR
ncbi:MAG: Glu/Leu/Phe/Val dehydrogenase dimerization domain-containing protein [Actinomycetota bacterium]